MVSKYFEEISQDTGKYCFGVEDTLQCLDMGAVETLIVWEELAHTRFTLINNTSGEVFIKNLSPEQEKESKHWVDEGVDLEVTEKTSLMEWLAENYKNFGCVLEFITNKSQEGSQFCRGFGGVGGILRYQVDLRSFEVDSEDDFYDSDDDF